MPPPPTAPCITESVGNAATPTDSFQEQHSSQSSGFYPTQVGQTAQALEGIFRAKVSCSEIDIATSKPTS